MQRTFEIEITRVRLGLVLLVDHVNFIVFGFLQTSTSSHVDD